MAAVEDEDEFRDADDGADTAPPPSSSPASTPSKSKPAAAAGGFGRRLLASIRLSTSFSAAIDRSAAPSSPKPPAPQPPAAPNLGLGLLLHQSPNPSADGSLLCDAWARDLHLLPTADLQNRHEEVRGEQGAAEDGEDQVIGHDVGMGEELAVPVPSEGEGQEKEDVVDGCSVNRNGYSAQDLDKEGEQHKSDELGAAMEDQVVMEQEGATKYYPAVEDQNNNDADHCTGDAPTAIKDDSAVEGKKAMEQVCAVGVLCVAEIGLAGGLQEEEDGLVEGQCEDGISVQDQHKLVEQCRNDEMGVTIGDSWLHDLEVVVVGQEGATEHFDGAVEYQSNNAGLEQPYSDKLIVIKDNNILEDKEEAVEQKGVIAILGAAEDGITVGLPKEDVMVEDQAEGDISVQDQDNVVEQCMSDALGVSMGDSAVHDQEVVVVEQEGVTEHFVAAMEDQIDSTVLEQHTSDELRVIKDDNVVEDKETTVEQEAAIDVLGAAGDGVAVGLREENVVDQGMRDELGVATGDSAVHDQVVVVVEQEGVVECVDAAMENLCNKAAMEQCTSDELREVNSGSFVEEKVKAVEQEGAIGLLDAAEDSASVGEEVVVVEGQGEDGISVQDKHKVVDQCTSNETGVAMGANTIQDHEVVHLEEVTEYFDAVVEDQRNNAAVEQRTHDESTAFRGDSFVEVKEKAVQQVVIDIFSAAKDRVAVQSQEKKGMVVEGQGDITVQDQEVIVEQEGITESFYAAPEDHSYNGYMSEFKDSNIVEIKEKALEQEGEFSILGAAENSVAVGLQGEDLMVKGQGEDDISVQDQYKVVEQCISDDQGVAMGDSVVQDQEVAVLDQEGVTGCFVAAAKYQSNNCTVEQCTSDELEAAKDGNFVEEKENTAVEEDAIDILGSAKDVVTMGLQEEGEMVLGEGVLSLQDQYKVVEQCTSDQVRTTTDVNAAHDQEVVEQEGAIFVRVATVDDIAIDAQEKAVKQSAADESRATKDAEDKEKVVDQEGLIDKRDAIKGGSDVEPQGDEGAAVKEQGEDDISVRDQDKVVEQCTIDQWRTTVDDNAAEDQEVRREKIRFCVGYPQRPGRPNCRVYMSTGSCSYGLSCCLNHPQVSSPQLKAKLEVPRFPSEQGNREVVQILELNRVGLPIRENARNCTYYMRNGNCRYGKRCCFNHPEHVLDVQLYKPTGWDDTNLPSSPHSKKPSSPHSKKSSEPSTLDGISSSSDILPPNIVQMLLPPQTVPPGTEAKEMKDPDWSSASDDSDGSADSFGGPLSKEEHHVDYPERPGRQECPFLLRYGNCKFASSCQYYHPNDKSARRYHHKGPSLSEELVYPDNLGAPECPFYMKTGACKFGTECKFHHPKDLSLSMQGPTIPKTPVDVKELHPETKTTPQYHMDQQQNYPERPGQPECRYYMQFGKCKFLSACIFHHPKDRVPSMPKCPFYMKTGTCQFGSACEFYHSSKGGEIDDGSGTEYGHNYPQRPGGNECVHFMKHGCCKFQMNCKYHHPTDRLSRK